MKSVLSGVSEPLPPPDILQESAIEPALRRVGALQGHVRLAKLKILGWFVEFAQMDLAASSPAELLTKQEEYAALQRYFWHEQKPAIPPSWELAESQKTIAFHLFELLDKGSTAVPRASRHIIIQLPEKLGYKPPEGHSGIVSATGRRGTPHTNIREKMGELLEEYATFILRCPRCKTIFVKPRANAEYCSRRCQNADYMQRERQRILEEQKKLAEQKELEKSRRQQKKGGH
jgi:endogenous inhibitor of DNA gyrase (YacG/DUF329 family)